MRKGDEMTEEQRKRISDSKKGNSYRLGHRSPNIKGRYFDCAICGKSFYRSPGQINGTKGNHPKTCSRTCQSVLYRGDGNPFWGKTHSDEFIAFIKKHNTGRTSPNKGKKFPPPSQEQRIKQSEAMKKYWQEHREEIMATLPRGLNHRFYKLPEERRHRKEFSPLQRREWKSDCCAFCGTTDNLVLDHIIPVFDGGTCEIFNVQTLCQPCNLWKREHVDLPRYYATLAYQKGLVP